MIELPEPEPDGTRPPVKTANLDAAYGAKKVLEDITFSARKGEFLGLIGPNGSGKTTLLKVLSRIIAPEAGAVYLDGRDLETFAFRELAQNLAVVPQEIAIGFDYTVRDVVMMGRHPYIDRFGSENENDLRLCNQAMDLTRVRAFADASVNEISGGEKQRVIIARALAQEPRILLLDEATSNLDINNRIEILNLIKGLTGTITVLSVFHDLNLAAYYCDRLVLLKDRKIYAIGTPAEVLTAENIKALYTIEALVKNHPLTNKPYVLPVYEQMRHGEARRSVHIICGGGAGSDIMRLLHGRGFRLSTGVLNIFDSDYATATELGVPCVTEAPFSRISEQALAHLNRSLERADSIVVTAMPIGEGNVDNIRILQRYRNRQILFLDSEGAPGFQDFTGGEATALITDLTDHGAVRVDRVDRLLQILESAG